jgi:hypothetical protein
MASALAAGEYSLKTVGERELSDATVPLTLSDSIGARIHRRHPPATEADDDMSLGQD